MKQINILTGFLLSVAIFAGCKKDNNNNLQSVSRDVIYTSGSAAYPVAINYKLSIQPSSGSSLILWKNGYVNANEIVFNADYNNGEKMSRASYGTKITSITTLAETQVLGNVYVPQLSCNNGSFTIDLGTTRTNSSLLLNGTYIPMSGAIAVPNVPVQVIITGPAQLNSAYVSNITTYTMNYWEASIILNTDQLISGINAGMLSGAIRTSGTIIISGTSNANLYQIILNNLQNNLMPVQFVPQNMVTSNSAAL